MLLELPASDAPSFSGGIFNAADEFAADGRRFDLLLANGDELAIGAGQKLSLALVRFSGAYPTWQARCSHAQMPGTNL